MRGAGTLRFMYGDDHDNSIEVLVRTEAGAAAEYIDVSDLVVSVSAANLGITDTAALVTVTN